MHTLRVFCFIFFSLIALLFSRSAIAQEISGDSVFSSPSVLAEEVVFDPFDEGVVTLSGDSSSAAAKVEETVREILARDLTETAGPAKSRLAQYLDDNPAEPFAVWNSLQYVIRRAVDRGVPANTLVLLLLFPVTATLIAIFRHIIGLRGFGVYTPAVLAVAFLSTGLSIGLVLFGLVFVITTLGKTILARLRLQYLPRTALLIWFVSLSMFGFMVLAPELSLSNVVGVGIFPILVLVLLSENFLEAEQMGSFRGAMQLTLETLFLAAISALFMRTLPVQEFVILHPEFTILTVFVVNILVGRYTGLRVMELLRFRSVIEPEEE